MCVRGEEEEEASPLAEKTKNTCGLCAGCVGCDPRAANGSTVVSGVPCAVADFKEANLRFDPSARSINGIDS